MPDLRLDSIFYYEYDSKYHILWNGPAFAFNLKTGRDRI